MENTDKLEEQVLGQVLDVRLECMQLLQELLLSLNGLKPTQELQLNPNFLVKDKC